MTPELSRLFSFLPPSPTPPVAFFVPGRVEFLGKHTDYAGGRALLCTVNRGFTIAAVARPDDVLHIRDVKTNESGEFSMSPDLVPTPGHWSNYPLTVARRLARNFGLTRGAHVAFASDLPPAAGLSSSSAFIVATFLALSALNHLEDHPAYRVHIRSPEDLAGYLGCIENGQSFGALAGDRGVGTFGGSEDHTAMLCSQLGYLVQYSFCPVRHEATVPFPANHVLAIGVSGVVAEKTGAAREQYNLVARRAREITRLWNQATGRQDRTLSAALQSSPDALARLRTILTSARETEPLNLLSRLDQFQTESNEIIPQVTHLLSSLCASSVPAVSLWPTSEGGAMENGKWKMENSLAALIALSQSLAETALHNQTPETIALVQLARQLGAPAASAFGAGFGGSVYALIPTPQSESFLHHWQAAYTQAFPHRTPSFFLTDASTPAHPLAL